MPITGHLARCHSVVAMPLPVSAREPEIFFLLVACEIGRGVVEEGVGVEGILRHTPRNGTMNLRDVWRISRST